MGNYIVTGCAGFIGSHLSEALVARGDRVLGIDSFTDYYAREDKENNLSRVDESGSFELVEADLVTAELPSLLTGADGIFHLAARPGVRGSWGASFAVYVRDNLLATQHVFEAAAEHGIPVVFASSSSVYGDAAAYPTREDVEPVPRSPYGVTKVGCEHLARVYGQSFDLRVTSLRYFTVYGPRQRPDMAFTRLFTALLTGTEFHLNGTGDQSRDFTYVADAVEATIAAMDRGPAGAVYNVGGGCESSLRKVIELAESLAGHSVEITAEPTAAGDVFRTAADTTRIREELGWRPATSLADGLRAQFDSLAGNAVGTERARGRSAHARKKAIRR
jgi:nucleoside-diphosphate-sugar epimerase